MTRPLGSLNEPHAHHFGYVSKNGEFVAEGRPAVEGPDGLDKLLFMLRLVHGESRYDLFQPRKEDLDRIRKPNREELDRLKTRAIELGLI